MASLRGGRLACGGGPAGIPGSHRDLNRPAGELHRVPGTHGAVPAYHFSVKPRHTLGSGESLNEKTISATITDQTPLTDESGMPPHRASARKLVSRRGNTHMDMTRFTRITTISGRMATRTGGPDSL